VPWEKKLFLSSLGMNKYNKFGINSVLNVTADKDWATKNELINK